MSRIWVCLCVAREFLCLNILLQKLQVGLYLWFPIAEMWMVQLIMVQCADCRTSLDSVIMCEFLYLVETAANCYSTPKTGSFIHGLALRWHLSHLWNKANTIWTRCVMLVQRWIVLDLNTYRRWTPEHLKEEFICDVCNKSFLKDMSLRDHKRKTHGDLVECPVCPKKFSNDSNCQKHVKTCHLWKNTVTCNACDKCFSSPSDLTRHMTTHEILKLK